MTTHMFAPVLSLALWASLPAPIVIQEVNVAAGLIRGGRLPVPVDAMLPNLNGAELKRLDGKPLEWKPAKANAEGWFEGDDFVGVYAHATVDTPEQGVYLLTAAGNSLSYINGQMRPGDVYGYGYLVQPVDLKAGTNDLLFLCQRGRLRVQLEKAEGPFVQASDATLPDLLVGEQGNHWVGVTVVNPSHDRLRGTLEAQVDTGSTSRTLFDVPPMTFRKVAVTVQVPGGLKAGEASLKVSLDGNTSTFKLRVLDPLAVHKRTFVSNVDGSVQYYAVNPAQKPAAENALVLSLHGASVEALGQASAYSSKDWVTLVAATNRRPYGFDWEEIGRLDALEVLADAGKRYAHDPLRVSLTGHSMGGHGTWQVGLTHPDQWAAIAPSAGWESFFSYGGTPTFKDEGVEGMISRALAPAKTLTLARNSLHYPVYVLHGDADDNVPVTEARTMRDALTFHPSLTYHEHPGGSHWWGNDCVDWPGIFDLFKTAKRKTQQEVFEYEFATANPAVSGSCHWTTVEQQVAPLQLSALRTRRSSLGIEVWTKNVARLTVDLRQLPDVVGLQIDGQLVSVPHRATHVTAKNVFGRWTTQGIGKHDKSALRSGPFKQVFNRRMVFVYGTRDEGQLLRLAVAVAEGMGYRGNGQVEVVADTEFKPTDFKGRNVVFFGNARTNAAWGALDTRSQVLVSPGEVSVGGRKVRSLGLVSLEVRPNMADPTSLVGFVGVSGDPALRLAERLAYWGSGVAYPDWIVMEAGDVLSGVGGIVAAGFFANDWSFNPKDAVWRD